MASTASNVQDADDTSIPEDVRTCLLDYATAGLAVAQMKGGPTCPWVPSRWALPAPSSTPTSSAPTLACVRNEYIDMTEFTCRIEEGTP